MTIERMNEISEYLSADVQKTQALLALSPEEASVKLTDEGFAVTADELIEFGQKLGAKPPKEGELDESDLEEVAGGLGPCFWIIVGAVGYEALRRW